MLFSELLISEIHIFQVIFLIPQIIMFLNLTSEIQRLFYQLKSFIIERKYDILVIFLVQYIFYHYLFSSLLFNDHTFLSSFYLSYPSYKTDFEGRWLADIIVSLHGSIGSLSLQMFVVAFLQCINGLVFAKFLGLEKRVERLMCALIFTMYPVFLDYFSYNIDGISFALGDFIILAAFYSFDRLKIWGLKTLLPTFLMFLSMAIYQPKISLIILLVILFAILKLIGSENDNSILRKKVLNEVLWLSSIFIMAIVCYYLSTKLIEIEPNSKTKINSPIEILQHIKNSYSKFVYNFSNAIEHYLPFTNNSDFSTKIPLIIIIISVLSMFGNLINRGRSIYSILLVLFFLVLIPIALNTSKIINSATSGGGGRIYFNYAYAFIFFLFQLRLKGYLGSI